jgi:hypothetical protein
MFESGSLAEVNGVRQYDGIRYPGGAMKQLAIGRAAAIIDHDDGSGIHLPELFQQLAKQRSWPI